MKSRKKNFLTECCGVCGRSVVNKVGTVETSSPRGISIRLRGYRTDELIEMLDVAEELESVLDSEDDTVRDDAQDSDGVNASVGDETVGGMTGNGAGDEET